MPTSAQATGPDPCEPASEPRWPIVLAVSTFILVTVVVRTAVPPRQGNQPHWVLPAVEVVLLVAITASAQPPC